MSSENSDLCEWTCDINDDMPGYVELSLLSGDANGFTLTEAYFTPDDARILADALLEKAGELDGFSG